MKMVHSRVLGGMIATVVLCCGLFSASAQQAPPMSYRNVPLVKAMIESTMQLRQNQDPAAIYYANGISFVDDFIPVNLSMADTNDPSWSSYYKYTYYDGRLGKVEGIDGSGKVNDSQSVWNNGAGAPVLVGDRDNKDGSFGLYTYADYDSSGKIQMICRFNQGFELVWYKVFSYQDNVIDIKEFTRNGKPMVEKIFDNGDIFEVRNGQKQFITHGDRGSEINQLAKFGLKPIYPGY